jgi:uncharacterized protein (DUF427 family)
MAERVLCIMKAHQPPGPGQESVWDYPRPPRLEACHKHIQIIMDGQVIADTQRAWRVLETSHPPVYYIPPEDIHMEYLKPASHHSYCEWKGEASYYTLHMVDRRIPNIAWYYPRPTADFVPITNHLAFYPSKVEACYIDGERVQAQQGDFYGGWITSDIVGPFKGGPGTAGW